MKNKVLQRIISFIAACMIFSMGVVPCFAEGMLPQEQKTGTLGITMTFHDEPVAGGKIMLYYVGIPTEDGTSYSYAYSKEFKLCDLSLDNLSDSELPQQLAEFAEKYDKTGIVKEINDLGRVLFSELKKGLYLVVQTEPAEDYNPIPPFMFEMPYYDSDSENWDYTVEAEPKLTPKVAPDNVSKPDMITDDFVPTKPSSDILPHTGQLNWPIPVLAFAGVVLFIIGWSLYSTRGKRR